MARSLIEKQIAHRQSRKGLLVPLMEDLFQSPVEIESEEDVDWIADLLRRMVVRQNQRTNSPVFSPSQLAECLRYVYLLKHHKEFEISKSKNLRPEANYYFFNGNFVHIKWQFALYKLDKMLPDDVFKLHGVEVPIRSKRKDHGGTVDALCSVYGEPTVVDFKGLNVRTFGEITRGFVPPEYLVQVADYGMLYNSQRQNGSRITTGLLVSESKGGPTPKIPVALHETQIKISTYLPEVRSRLEVLRKHEQENSIPPPECKTTQGFQFLGCPFRKFCKEEVKAIQRANAKREDAEGLSVAESKRSRSDRSRRNSRR